MTLFHNSDAGFESYSAGHLLEALQSRGFEPIYRSIDDDLTESLRDPGGLVIIAGGDGTVGNLARRRPRKDRFDLHILKPG